MNVTFQYEQSTIIIQAKLEDKMEEIIGHFLAKTEIKKKDDIFFLYNGKKINNDESLLI